MLKIEPKFSEAIQGASIGNCYLESNFTGKVQTRLKGRMDLAEADFPKWNNALAAFESSKTRNVYIITQTGYKLDLWLLRRGKCTLIKTFQEHYNQSVPSGFAEMRFLDNDYVRGFAEGNYGILFHVAGNLYVMDDLNPVESAIKKFTEFEKARIRVGGVCVVANRIIVSELERPKWFYSSTGGMQTKDNQGNALIKVFDVELNNYEAEYSGDAIVGVARAGGIRLAIFGEKTLELWDISGNPDNPFTTSYSGQVYKLGCVKDSITEICDTVYFCGIEDLSGRNGIYSIGREGLKKLSEHPLDTEITMIANAGGFRTGCGRYSENAAGFYLLHLAEFSIAYCIPENSFSKFYHVKARSADDSLPFNCLLSGGGLAVGFKNSIYRIAEGDIEHTGQFTEKKLTLPVFDNGGNGHFSVNKLAIDMQTVTMPRTAPPENNCIVVDYSPDGTDTFIGQRHIEIPEAGNRKAYPIQLWGLGRANNLILRLRTATLSFIMNALIIESEEIL